MLEVAILGAMNTATFGVQVIQVAGTHGKVEQIKTRRPLDDAPRPSSNALKQAAFSGRARSEIVNNRDVARRERGRAGVRGRICGQMRPLSWRMLISSLDDP